MIISATRRADLPALYADWFVNRVRAGWCAVPNPFNPAQVSRISLRPQDVDAVVFWSRWPAPLTRRLDELESLGLMNTAFLVTLLDYPRTLDAKSPPLSARLDAFKDLSRRVGPERIVWRYDPMVFSNVTTMDWHAETFGRLAAELEGHTRRCIVSVLDVYRKIRPRLAALAGQGVLVQEDGMGAAEQLLPELARMAQERGMSIQTCAQANDWTRLGTPPGACLDAAWLNQCFGLELSAGPDPHQRKHCLCAPSRDIGMYDACTLGCAYCYATSSFEAAARNRREHAPDSPSLLGRYVSAEGPPDGPPQPGCAQARLPGT